MTRASLLLATMLALSACGGGGESGQTPPPVAVTPLTTVSGIAAAGAPLQGTIIIKDGFNNLKATGIKADGSFSFDVSQMKAPFMLRAQGDANGTSYVLHAAATDADGNGHFNVTPLSELIVARAVGQSPAQFYAAANFSQLGKTQLDQQEAALQARIQPLLDAAKVPSSVDLRRQVFAADLTGLDAVLEAVEVSIDADNKQFTLRNRLNGATLSDGLRGSQGNSTLKADADSSEALEAVAASVKLAKQHLSLNEFTQGQEILALLHPDYLSYGHTKADEAKDLEYLASSTSTDYDRSIKRTLISYQIQGFKDGVLTLALDTAQRSSMKAWNNKDQRSVDLQFKRDAAGKWLLQGNQYPAGFTSIEPANASTTACFENCKYMAIELYDSVNNKIKDGFAYAVVKGPGLPEGGVRATYTPSKFSDNSGSWVFDKVKTNSAMNPDGSFDLNTHMLWIKTDVAKAQMGKWPVYALEVFDRTGKLIYIEREVPSIPVVPRT
ncbi:hypothetical protein [Chitinimonas taiwanensis]|nr:hypothetical protein [Chitinimonas taiwanensis]